MRYSTPTHRLYVSAPIRAEEAIPLDNAQMHYCLSVLRMSAGARLFTFNGMDGEWEAELLTPSRKLTLIVPKRQNRPQPLRGQIRYAFAPLKSARLDYMIQKAVEMGACSIEPVITARTQARGLKREKIGAHIIEAAEQCGVLSLPEIAAERPLATWLAALPADCRLIFCDEEANSGASFAQMSAGGPAAVLIGPEGGFDADERARLRAHPGVITLSLGPRILRGDTAGVAALTLVQTMMGDWPNPRSR